MRDHAQQTAKRASIERTNQVAKEKLGPDAPQSALPQAPPPPFVWEMARYCLDLPGGTIRHFPAGTYHEQTYSHTGQVELALMEAVHSAWYVFSYLSPERWKAQELRIVGWLRERPPPPEPPTRRLDSIIAALWRVSWWARQNLGQGE